MTALLIAVQFLTRVPVRLPHPPSARELGLSLLWYPIVGLLLGALLYGLALGLDLIAPALRPGLLLVAWVWLTGALHIDGLGDTADAWIGGRGDRERMLTIMKDPRAGSGAVAVIVPVLLLKFQAIAVISGPQRIDLLLPPILARVSVPALFASTPYVRSGGIATDHAAQLPRSAAVIVVVVSLLAAGSVFGELGVVAVLVAAATFLIMRTMLMRSLGGTTGDTAGAMIELTETAVLIAIATQASAGR
jgi:adenosylcobinamide-GDP ribazoletransferase